MIDRYNYFYNKTLITLNLKKKQFYEIKILLIKFLFIIFFILIYRDILLVFLTFYSYFIQCLDRSKMVAANRLFSYVSTIETEA